MKVIGLTGGIASGKSTATKILKEFEIPIIDADLIAREIVLPGKAALHEIEVIFGKTIINEDGSLNRKKLGEIVFSDKEKLKKLNSITHKRIIEEMMKRVNIYRNANTYPVIIIDAPLLLELHMQNLVDEVWLVTANEAVQLNRLMSRDEISEDDALKRIEVQMRTEEKRKYADVILDNNRDLNHLRYQIQEQLKRVTS